MLRRRWWVLAGVALVVAWVAFVGLRLVSSAQDLRAGRDEIKRVRDGLDAKALASGAPLPDLGRARGHFGAARRATGGLLFAPVRVLPVVGRQLRSVNALSGAAFDVADAAVGAVSSAQRTLAERGGAGPARVQQIAELTQTIESADRRVHAVDLGPRVALLGPLADARNELATQLDEARTTLDDALAGAKAGLSLLQGPRRYLVVAANNAEMRAGSGMWLSGGVLTTAAGRFDLGPVAPLYQQADPPPGNVPAIGDADLAARWGRLWSPNIDWRALMVSPRMPASAELGLRMWQAAGKEPINGVLVVDPVGLAALVKGTGPVSVGGRTFTGDDIVPELLHDQYLQFRTDTPEQGDRREALGAIAGAAFRTLDGGQWSPADLAGELAKAIGGRHLLAWSSDPVEERGWVAAGMAGDLAKDSLLVSVLNRGGNKLDWFLPVDATLGTAPAGDGTEVTVRLSLANRTPPGQPTYVAGPPFGQRWAPGTYVGVVTVDLPGAATDVRVEGGDVVEAGKDGPAQVIATQVQLGAGETKGLLVRFRLPGRRGSIAVEASGRVPGISWHYGSRSWQDSSRRVANW